MCNIIYRSRMSTIPKFFATSKHSADWPSATMAKLLHCPHVACNLSSLSHRGYDCDKSELHTINLRSCKRDARIHGIGRKHNNLSDDNSQYKPNAFCTSEVNSSFVNVLSYAVNRSVPHHLASLWALSAGLHNRAITTKLVPMHNRRRDQCLAK
jgi:hypothetical protein